MVLEATEDMEALDLPLEELVEATEAIEVTEVMVLEL